MNVSVAHQAIYLVVVYLKLLKLQHIFDYCLKMMNKLFILGCILTLNLNMIEIGNIIIKLLKKTIYNYLFIINFSKYMIYF